MQLMSLSQVMVDLLDRNGAMFATPLTPLSSVVASLPQSSGPLDFVRTYSIANSATWAAIDLLDQRHRALTALARLIVTEEWEDDESTSDSALPINPSLDLTVGRAVF